MKEDREALRLEYDCYVAEARACGYEIVSFREWLGDQSARETAEHRLSIIHDRDESDLY
tara:strand:+ start:173 stop:349 length:177 start_codon:yes stop_codon:yes gene_type:complete